VKSKSGKITYTKAFSNALLDIAEIDDKVLAITAAMDTGTGTDVFSRKYPHRFYDVGIAEQHAVTFAAALARGGMKPVVAIYSTFLQRAYDQIVHDVALQKLPVIFAMDRAGLVGEDGPTHHGVFDISYLRHIPEMILMAPKDEKELGDMLYSATKYNSPAAIRYPRGEGTGVIIDRGRFEIIEKGRGSFYALVMMF
jgi:1-deoxy-D-xylulose-5-phosphate synthase